MIKAAIAPHPTARIDSNRGRSSPIFAQAYWSPTKSLWVTFMYLGAMLGGYATFRWDSFLLFVATSFVTLCAGYSVGIHRRLIHNSFQCPQWLENTLVYLGVLAGLGGPFSLVEQHDMREWAQRQSRCHDYYSNSQNLVVDWILSLHCDLQLHYPPIFRYEPRLSSNGFYQWLEQTWMLQQLPWAVAFYHFGGWSWVFWGIYMRIAVSITGHWLLEYASNQCGLHSVQGVAVQKRNLPVLCLFSFGESWQQNHQIFPQSAQFGLQPKQYDPGWWFIKALSSIGLAWDIQQPSRVVSARPHPASFYRPRPQMPQAQLTKARIPVAVSPETASAPCRKATSR
ncbi:MAG: hypothetical protein WA885_24860 [Phormidesmis sp.]